LGFSWWCGLGRLVVVVVMAGVGSPRVPGEGWSPLAEPGYLRQFGSIEGSANHTGNGHKQLGILLSEALLGSGGNANYPMGAVGAYRDSSQGMESGLDE